MKFQEHVKGAILHLQVIWVFLEKNYDQGTLLERVKLSSFMVHMIILELNVFVMFSMDTTWKIICWLKSPLLIDKRCKKEDFLFAQKDKKALDNYVKNEQNWKHNDGKRSTNTYSLASPQACPTTTPLLESTSMLPTTSSHIPFVIRSGKQSTWLGQF